MTTIRLVVKMQYTSLLAADDIPDLTKDTSKCRVLAMVNSWTCAILQEITNDMKHVPFIPWLKQDKVNILGQTGKRDQSQSLFNATSLLFLYRDQLLKKYMPYLQSKQATKVENNRPLRPTW